MNYFINLHISKIRFFFYFKRKDIFVKVECFYAKKKVLIQSKSSRKNFKRKYNWIYSDQDFEKNIFNN